MATPCFRTFPLLGDGRMARTLRVAPLGDDGLLGPPVEQAFSDADADAWAERLLADVDRFLSPELAAAVYADEVARGALDAVRLARTGLADRLARGLVPVLDGVVPPGPDVASVAVREALERGLHDTYVAATVVTGGTEAYVGTVADPAAAASFAADVPGLGPVTVPVPLRAHPAPPMIRDQSATATYPADPPALGRAGQWTYAVSYVAESAAQDDVAVTLLLDAAPPPALAQAPAAAAGDLTAALGAYVAVAPAVWTLLTAFATDAADVPPDTRRNAAATFASLVEGVVAAWPEPGPRPEPTAVAAAARTVSVRVGADGLTLVAGAEGPGPGGTWPDVAYDGAALVAGKPEAGTRAYAFPAGVPPRRQPVVTLAWPGLRVDEHRSARAAVAVTRNAALLGPDGPATAASFVLRSGPVEAAADVSPALAWHEPVDITENGTLAEALPAALTALLGEASGVPVRAAVTYTTGPASLPVLLAEEPWSATFAAELVTAMDTWLATQPEDPGTAWHVALRVGTVLTVNLAYRLPEPAPVA